MSRLENKKKAGFFATPPALVERIVGHLQPPPDVGGTEGGAAFRWLDPCAGEGVTLAYLAHVHGGETYGIELDRQRAEAAAQVLDHVLAGDYAAVRISDFGFGSEFETHSEIRNSKSAIRNRPEARKGKFSDTCPNYLSYGIIDLSD